LLCEFYYRHTAGVSIISAGHGDGALNCTEEQVGAQCHGPIEKPLMLRAWRTPHDARRPDRSSPAPDSCLPQLKRRGERLTASSAKEYSKRLIPLGSFCRVGG
jgi:hypothetical protein